ELDALLPGPDEAAEYVGRLLQALAAAFAHHADELVVDVLHQRVDVLLVFLAQRREGIEHALVLARGDQAPLDAELVHYAGEAEAVHQHADRADDARFADIDAVGAGGDEIAARGADVLDDRVERDVGIFLAQPAHLVVDGLRLHRAAARRIDAHDDALRVLVLERRLQRQGDALGARIGAGRGDAVQLDQ